MWWIKSGYSLYPKISLQCEFNEKQYKDCNCLIYQQFWSEWEGEKKDTIRRLISNYKFCSSLLIVITKNLLRMSD